jgi:RNA polymerase sigma-70 factor (ECF subfamily)
MEAVDVPSAEPAPDEKAHAREVGEALRTAMQSLSAPNREAVVLRDVEGLSAEEAAAIAGIDVGAFKSRLHRARLELRAHLAGLLGDGSGTSGPARCPELAQELSAYKSAEIVVLGQSPSEEVRASRSEADAFHIITFALVEAIHDVVPGEGPTTR